jgi:hypothetical protein
MPHGIPWCNLHRVDVWELFPSHLWHSSFQKNFEGCFKRSAGNSCAGLGKAGWQVSAGRSG